MDKIKLNLDELMKAHQALNNFLAQTGINRKKAYLSDRNRKFIVPFAKQWDKKVKEVQDKYSTDLDGKEFIPYENYAAFKKAVKDLASESEMPFALNEGLANIFKKYEVAGPLKHRRGIPTEKTEDYHKEINEEAEKFEAELEFFMIEADETLDIVFSKLTGEDQAALGFMLKDKSNLEVIPGGKFK